MKKLKFICLAAMVFSEGVLAAETLSCEMSTFDVKKKITLQVDGPTHFETLKSVGRNVFFKVNMTAYALTPPLEGYRLSIDLLPAVDQEKRVSVETSSPDGTFFTQLVYNDGLSVKKSKESSAVTVSCVSD